MLVQFVLGLSSGWRITDLQPEIMEGETFFVEVTIDNWPGANQPEHNYFENRGGVIEQLKACGYEVVPDVWDTDRGTWEPLFKVQQPPRHCIDHFCMQLPRCMRTVYRQNDPNKTELITKPSRLGSHELDILRYLHSIDPPSPHIISFTPLRILGREWLILPKLHTLCNELLIDSRGVSGREQLGWGLVKGLAYLHEHNIAHLDIKPDNLVCDDDFRLKIIDFDIAIKVEDENTEIDEYCGTEDWTAPEVGERDSPTPPWYSPIKADRWSCGYVIWHHIMAGNGDSYLSKFAEQLMANDPQQRPSLPDWHKYLGAPFSDVSHVLKNGRPRKDMVEVDGENVKAPDAKRPRLETPSGWYCPNTTRPETDRYNVEI
jgi:hypothetical protein